MHSFMNISVIRDYIPGKTAPHPIGERQTAATYMLFFSFLSEQALKCLHMSHFCDFKSLSQASSPT